LPRARVDSNYRPTDY